MIRLKQRPMQSHNTRTKVWSIRLNQKPRFLRREEGLKGKETKDVTC